MAYLSLVAITLLLLSSSAKGSHQPKFTQKADCPGYDACWTTDSGMEKRDIYFTSRSGSKTLFDCEVAGTSVSHCFASGDVLTGKGPITVSIGGKSFAGIIEHNIDTSEYKHRPKELAKNQIAGLVGRSVDKQTGSLLGKLRKSRTISKRAVDLPPSGIFTINVQPVYDQRFKTQYGDASADTATAGLMHAQTAFLHPTMGPVKVQINALPPIEYSGTVTVDADTFVQLLSNPIWNDVPDTADMAVFMTYGDFSSPQRSFASPDSFCETSIKLKFAQVDFFPSERLGATVVTQVLGLTMGINYDFLDENNDDIEEDRFDSNLNNCNNVMGYMDLEADANKWSTCSVEDFTNFLESEASSCSAYLKPHECPMDLEEAWCPFLAQSKDDACDNDWMKERCQRSCDPVCSAALADVVFPTTCTPLTCMNETTTSPMPDTTTEAETTTEAAVEDMTPTEDDTCVCPTTEAPTPPPVATTPNGDGDCLDICPWIVQSWGCEGYDGVLECCKTSCADSQTTTEAPTNRLGGGGLTDQLSYCDELLQDPGFCRGVNAFYCELSCSRR